MTVTFEVRWFDVRDSCFATDERRTMNDEPRTANHERYIC